MPNKGSIKLPAGPERSRRLAALAVSLLFNAAVILAVLQVRFAGLPASPPPLELELVLEPAPPPPPPPPPPPEEKKPTPKIVARVARQAADKLAKPEQKTLAPTDPGPPVHFLDPAGEVAEGAGAIGGGQRGRGKQSGGARRGMHVPSDYAERVKSRIIAAKTYPAEARQKLQECFIAYTLSVDRNGDLLAYDIDPCGHPLLDQAARNAIAQAGPFPVPPDLGAERYDIHGSLVFKLE